MSNPAQELADQIRAEAANGRRLREELDEIVRQLDRLYDALAKNRQSISELIESFMALAARVEGAVSDSHPSESWKLGPQDDDE